MVAVEVAEMETTIQFLRDRVRQLELDNRTLETENAMYEARCRVAEEAALNELVRSTQMRQTLTDMSAMLISGLRKMEESVNAERMNRAEKEARRREQEAVLEVGSEDRPLFMTPESPAPVTAPSEPVIETSALKIPANEWDMTDVRSDIKKLAALGEPDKDSSFRR